MQREAQEYIKKCDQCQRFVPSIHQPGGVLNPLSSLLPFAQWGLDIVEPFPKAVGNRKYLLVSTDYFTKWVEAEPLANIRDVDAKRFVWKNIITRFGFLVCLSQTTAFNSTEKHLEVIVASWGLQIGILLQPIPKETDKQRL